MSVKKKFLKRKADEASLNEHENDNDDDTCEYNESSPATETVSKDLLIIAQEVQIVKALACNDLTKRNRQVRKLRKWLQLRSRSSFPLTEENFMRIWKGLYYNMWMADKPLVQEELAEQLAQLVGCFNDNVQYSVDFFGAFMRTMAQEWFGLDQWRLDKFMMLVRRMLRAILRELKKFGWSELHIKHFNEQMQNTALTENTTARGLTLHYLDIFFEELAKVSAGKISTAQVNQFLLPFVTYVGTQRDGKLLLQCRTRVLYHLLYQSPLGREYSEKYNAWKEMGFPTSSIDDLELAEDDKDATNGDDAAADDDENAKTENGNSQEHLDPRAGNVDVYVPDIPFDADCVINEFKRLLRTQEYNSKRRKATRKLIQIFETYKTGVFPLGIKRMPRDTTEPFNELIAEKVDNLENLENDVYGIGRKLKQLNKRKRRKLLRTINFDNVNEDNYEQTIRKVLPKSKNLSKKNKKARSSLQLMNDWKEEPLDIEVVGENGAANGNVDTDNGAANHDTKKQNGIVAAQKKKPESSDSTTETTNSKKQNGIVAQKKKPDSADSSIKTKKQNGIVPNKKKKPESTDSSTEITNKSKSAWNEELSDGEIEYYVPSRKIQVKKANEAFANAETDVQKTITTTTTTTIIEPKVLTTPKHQNIKQPVEITPPRTEVHTPQQNKNLTLSTPQNKRVKIRLKNNTAQKPSDYIKQIRSSPQLPYDANKKPSKGLLKPNSMPSPINPFYKKKIGLKLLNETF